ncbi:phosphatidylinositol-specific phospholipase C1-like protein [Spirosoma pollinicola]|uniref:Calcium-dependent phosphoinositide phospholipase C n=1 Tax=Spirosoma pollinicola TaxID=2057025 RepID=A0A2K8Z9M2_9BACT|nr:phosphatidylinositol-specific phospholipase C1-like protein [Spirosoma pollinicola]AUD06539.1 hypothetical protein CWM47_34640 [Spirosoma pollinicola]
MKVLLSTFLLIVLSAFMWTRPDDLPINQIQVIGSHNSYKQAIDPALFKAFQQKDSVSASKIDYEHIPLTDQLTMGLRNLEIDVYADEKGGRYAHPKGLNLAKDQAPYDPDHKMDQPGFKVFHIVDLDFRSHSLTLIDCLQQLRTWSEANPDHTPVFITLEGKDQPLPTPGYTVPEKFTEKLFDELDKTLLDYLGSKHLIIPDNVRSNYSTLEEAVLRGNWPTVNSAKGKFMFILDDKSAKRAMYMAGHPSLKGRVLFTNADPNTPEAATMIRNNPTDPAIKGLVKKGYIIRTRADSDTQQARANDTGNFVAACNSGAQIITTDYYLKSTHFKSDYSVSFDKHTYFRINPLFITQAAK